MPDESLPTTNLDEVCASTLESLKERSLSHLSDAERQFRRSWYALVSPLIAPCNVLVSRLCIYHKMRHASTLLLVISCHVLLLAWRVAALAPLEADLRGHSLALVTRSANGLGSTSDGTSLLWKRQKPKKKSGKKGKKKADDESTYPEHAPEAEVSEGAPISHTKEPGHSVQAGMSGLHLEEKPQPSATHAQQEPAASHPQAQETGDGA